MKPFQLFPTAAYGNNHGYDWMVDRGICPGRMTGFISPEEDDPANLFSNSLPSGIQLDQVIAYHKDLESQEIVNQKFYGFDWLETESLHKPNPAKYPLFYEYPNFDNQFTNTCEVIMIALSNITGQPKESPNFKWMTGIHGSSRWGIKFEETQFKVFFTASGSEAFAVRKYLGLELEEVKYPNIPILVVTLNGDKTYKTVFKLKEDMPFSAELYLGNLFRLIGNSEE